MNFLALFCTFTTKPLAPYHFMPNFNKNQYYPWVICMAGLLVLVVVNGLTTSSLSVFDETLMNEFNISRTELKIKDSITNLVATVLILVSGMLIDKFKVKRVMLFGVLVLGLGFLVFSKISGLFGMYFTHFLFGLAYISAGSVPCIILVSSWFHTKRGLALGITLIGTSLGGFIFPNILTHLIQTIGWRDTFQWLTILPLILFIFILLLVRSSPSDLGLKPYGLKKHTDTHANNHSLLNQGMDFKDAIRTPVFWIISGCGFMTFYSVVAVVSNLFLHMRGFDFDAQTASAALSLYFLLALIGKFIISTLSDYLNVYVVFTACAFCMTIGMIGFATMDKSIIFYAVGLTALSWGGIYTLYNVMIVKTFGLKSAGKINGVISAFESSGSFLGPILTGFIFDQTHSYQLAFVVISCVMVVTTLLSFRFRSYAMKHS